MVTTALSTIFCDGRFCVDLGHITLFFVTNLVWGGSKQDDSLLELEDWVRSGQISAGAGGLTYLTYLRLSDSQNPEVTRFF